MSQESDKGRFSSPYKLMNELEKEFWLMLDGKEVNRTFHATRARVKEKVSQFEIVEVYFDRLDLDQFRFKSGRVNRRAGAKELLRQLEQRNQHRSSIGQSVLRPFGLRTMEDLVDYLISEK